MQLENDGRAVLRSEGLNISRDMCALVFKFLLQKRLRFKLVRTESCSTYLSDFPITGG